MGGHGHGRDLHGFRSADELDSAAVSGRAQARPGLLSGDAIHASGISDAADRTGLRARPAVAAHRELGRVEAVARVGGGLPAHVCRRAMAVRQFPDVAAGAQLVLWNHLLRLQHQSQFALLPLPFPASGTRSRVLEGDGAGVRDFRDPDPARVRRRRPPAADPEMKLKLLAVWLCALPLLAHVGSPDVFYEGEVGPYHLMVTIRPQQVIPGVAEVEIRSTSPEVRQVRIVPLPMTGPGARFAPVPDVAQPSREDPQYYTGSLWLMGTGSWQVRVSVDGARGPGNVSVPVPALSTRVLGMQRALEATLIVLGLVLTLGIVSLIGAGTREAQLEPGKEPDAAHKRRARIAMAATALVAAAGLWLGNSWWNVEAGAYQGKVFKPLALRTHVEGANRLVLQLEDPGWLTRRTDDLLPDHGHLMHLYVIHVPEMDRVWHLHPDLTGGATFTQSLPDMPAGRYRLYGDIVHASGFPDTATAEIDLPAISGRPLTGDDAAGAGPPIAQADYNRNVMLLPDGYRMVWERGTSAF